MTGGAAGNLVDLFWAENYDLVVPSTEISLLTMLSPEIPDDIYERAVLAPRRSLRAALDKQEIWNLARKLGVRVPTSEMISSSNLPPKDFPVVLKPVFSKKNNDGVVQEFCVTIARDLAHWSTALKSIYSDIPVQQQEYIPGKGMGVEMLFEHGEPRWAFLHERVHELPLTGGGSSYRVSVDMRNDLTGSAVTLLSALHWHGVAMVEFKVSPRGETYLMEINPRLWGSLALAVDCGVNFPVGLLCLSTKQPLPAQPKYRTGYFSRNIYRDIEWFKANLKADHSDPLLLTSPIAHSVIEWLRPLLGKESWDYFCWSDLGPLAIELKTLVLEHWDRVVNVIKRRSLHLYLRHFQQMQMLRKLRWQEIESVLILCYGHICRSPLAAALAVRRFQRVRISSAGFFPISGRPSPDFVLSTANELGIDLAEHRSKCVDIDMINEAQLILIMDTPNYDTLKTKYPQALDRALFLGMLLPDPQLEISDPFDTPGVMPELALTVNRAIEGLGRFLR